ncbi:MAG: hypothetical protein KGJ98_10625 [Chloroflexota bacterium]|nr:hypothetical protein [Chloroflexota bacterium]MDE3102676.1 hypothetical protein [Chloroflexota bacterium]
MLPLVLGALAVALIRAWKMPVQLPGHQGVIWMAALVAARLVSRSRLGATVGGVGAFAVGMLPPAEASQALGILAAGIVLDAASSLRSLATPLLWSIGMGAIGNAVVLLAKLALGDLPRAILREGVGFGLETYLAFGALGGLCVGLGALAASYRECVLPRRRA